MKTSYNDSGNPSRRSNQTDQFVIFAATGEAAHRRRVVRAFEQAGFQTFHVPLTDGAATCALKQGEDLVTLKVSTLVDAFEPSLSSYGLVLETSTMTFELERAELQPVWSCWPLWEPLGISLLIDDDNFACQQVDLVHEAFSVASLLRNDTRRSCVTTQPRPGWRKYGHPDVYRRR
ncbi:MAG: hypothetical protein JWR63_4393 [Conexibacter sp.]|nr:hypothetical protein [Conexibacter sp.]